MIKIHMFHIFIQASWEEKLYSRMKAVLWFVESLARLALARAQKTETRGFRRCEESQWNKNQENQDQVGAARWMNNGCVSSAFTDLLFLLKLHLIDGTFVRMIFTTTRDFSPSERPQR